MKPLTEIEALTQTTLLWEWLAEDPEREKADWPGWTDENSGKVIGDCFLCQYDYEHGVNDCEQCPLLHRWDGNTVCSDKGAPFDVWETSVGEERQRAAALIESLCRKELARLEGVGE